MSPFFVKILFQKCSEKSLKFKPNLVKMCGFEFIFFSPAAVFFFAMLKRKRRRDGRTGAKAPATPFSLKIAPTRYIMIKKNISN